MKVLVIGRSGQLARAVVEAGARATIEVAATGRPELELTERASIASGIERAKADIVVNAAAYTAVDKAESEPDLARAVNAQGAGHVAQVCAGLGIPVIHLSTDYVFDGRGQAYYDERDPVGPVNVYGRTKLEGERLVAAACPRHMIVRTAWVHSPWGHNFVKTVLRLARTCPEVKVVDDQRGCPTYAPHLAEALLAIARCIVTGTVATPWGIYHAAGHGETTWYGFAREIFRQGESHGLPAPNVRAIATSDYPTAARRPSNSRLDCARLRRTFGIALPDWREGVAACVDRLARGLDGI